MLQDGIFNQTNYAMEKPQTITTSVVRLRSGGPKMTVMDKAWGIGFVCQWFLGDALQYGTFSEASLEIAGDDAPADDPNNE